MQILKRRKFKRNHPYNFKCFITRDEHFVTIKEPKENLPVASGGFLTL
jgi:hypothetical protein